MLNWLKDLFSKLFSPKVINAPEPAPIVPSLPPGIIRRPLDLPDSNHYASKDPNILSLEYEFLWSIVKITDEFKSEASRLVAIIIKNKVQYQAVENALGIPWWVVAVMHARESGCDFNTYLGNGEPLGRKTRLVPQGRGPFSSWHAGAIDALTIQGYANKKDWSLGRCFYRIEAFNGFGYRTGRMQNTTPRNASPYMYSGTEFYQCGKAVSDGNFVSTVKDKQIGAMALAKKLSDMGEKLF